MAKSTRSKVKRAFRAKKRTQGVYAAVEAARLQRLNAKLRVLTTTAVVHDDDDDTGNPTEGKGKEEEEEEREDHDVRMSAAAGDGDDAETTVIEGPAVSFLHVLTVLSNSSAMLCMYRCRWKCSSENQGESVYSWSKRVASRAVEGLKGHGTTSPVKRNEQTRLSRSTVQVRTSSETEIGIYYGRYCCGWFCSAVCLRYRIYGDIVHSVSDFLAWNVGVSS